MSNTREGETIKLPALALLVEGASVGEPLRVGHGDDLTVVERLSLLEPSEESGRTELTTRLLRVLEESCKEWEFAPRKSQLTDPLIALTPIRSTTKADRRRGLIRIERALDVLHFRSRVAFSNYFRLVAHHVEDATAIGAIIEPDFSLARLPGPARLVAPAILKAYPADFMDNLVCLPGDKLTEVQTALLNVLAWWRRAKQETDPTFTFAFLWFAIESGIPAGERDEGALRRRVGMLARYPTGADVQVVESDTKASAIYKNRDVEAGRKLRDLIGAAYGIRCDIVHQGVSHTSTPENQKPELEQIATLFAYHWVPQLASLLAVADQEGVRDLADAWAKCAVPVIFSVAHTKESYAPPFLKEFDLEKSRLFRW